MSELSRDMQLIADAIGEDNARLLMKRCPGINVYIPSQVSKGDIIKQLRTDHYDAKITARNTGASLARVYRIMKEIREAKK